MKRTGIFILSFIGLLVIALIAGWFYPADSYQPPHRPDIEAPSPALLARTGLYELPGGEQRLLFPSVEGGMLLCGFGLQRDDLSKTAFRERTADSLFAASTTSQAAILFSDAEPLKAEFIKSSGERLAMQRMQNAAYSVSEVAFQSDDIKLSGLLFLPNSELPTPAVAFIHGSGISDRERFWYLSPADYLARRGIAVMLPDKRGCGKSEGAWHTSSFDDFADDALAAVKFLTKQPSIDQKKLGLAGFSQGGWVAPLAASKSDALAFIISISGSAAMPSQQLLFELQSDIASEGVPQFLSKMIAPFLARRIRLGKAEWWARNGDFNPIPHWQKVDAKVLLLLGEADRNVDVARTLSLLRGAGLSTRPGFNVETYPALSHALISEKTGWLEEHYLQTMSNFIKRL